MPEEDLWQSILSDVAEHTKSRRLPPRNVLVLGDEGAGKSALVARLQGRKHANEEHAQGTGLEYTYLDIKEEGDSEDIAGRLGVYTLDNSADYANLLPFVLNKETLESFLVMVVLDLQRPWTALGSLTHWMKVVDAHIKSINSPRLDELKLKMVEDCQRCAAGDAVGEDGEPILLPLESGVLTINIGLPVVVIGNKSDMADSLERDLDYRNEHFDFIQLHLRKACLKYGATLAYSGRDGRSRDVILRYLAHRAYGFALNIPPNVADRDAIFVPGGWDNEKKIAMLHAGLKSITAEDTYEDQIVGPQTHKDGASVEHVAEDEQDFLRKQQVLLSANPKESAAAPKSSSTAPLTAQPSTRSNNGPASPAPGRQSVASSTTTALPATRPSPTATPSPGGATATAPTSGPARTDGAARGAPGQSNDVLANFFNSLLKKPGPGKAEAPK